MQPSYERIHIYPLFCEVRAAKVTFACENLPRRKCGTGLLQGTAGEMLLLLLLLLRVFIFSSFPHL